MHFELYSTQYGFLTLTMNSSVGCWYKFDGREGLIMQMRLTTVKCVHSSSIKYFSVSLIPAVSGLQWCWDLCPWWYSRLSLLVTPVSWLTSQLSLVRCSPPVILSMRRGGRWDHLILATDFKHEDPKLRQRKGKSFYWEPIIKLFPSDNYA